MSAPKRSQIGNHFLDAGPLFCLGGSQVLADLFDEHFLLKSKVVAGVAAEVRYNATLVLPAVGPHPKRGVQKAARVVQGRYKQLIAGAVAAPALDPALLGSMKAELQARLERNTPGKTVHPLKNDGEAESVYWAANDSVEIIANDADAHYLAAKHGVTSSTFVEVTRHLVKVQKVVKNRALYRELAGLGSRGIYVGEHITSELDLI